MLRKLGMMPSLNDVSRDSATNGIIADQRIAQVDRYNSSQPGWRILVMNNLIADLATEKAFTNQAQDFKRTIF